MPCQGAYSKPRFTRNSRVWAGKSGRRAWWSRMLYAADNRSVLEYSNMVERDLPDKLFTKDYLKKLSR